MMLFRGNWTARTVLLLSLAFRKTTSTFLDQENFNNNHFDYVILGGGTAGMVVASRLSENPRITVAVIEAGDFERSNPNVTNPSMLGLATHTHVDWEYKTAPLTFTDNRTIIWSAGKGLGGSSLINGMTYIRPASSQIDLWPSLGLELDWEKLLASGKKGEKFQPPSPALTALGASYKPSAHGFQGPLLTTVTTHLTQGDIHDVFNSTMKRMGIQPNHEFNDGELMGFGVQQTTQDVLADVREDAARAYYYPVMDRENLVVIVNTTATRILWSSDNRGEKAVASGAEVSQHGKVIKLFAAREVILSAGALRSPAILENSGVGNPSVLARQSIDVKVNLPSVGENLQDQTTMGISATAKDTNSSGLPGFVAHTSLHDLFGNRTLAFYKSTLGKLPEYAKAIAAQNGGASSAATQEKLLKTQLDLLFNSNTPASEVIPFSIGTFMGVVFWALQPFSRGSVHINSTDRTAQPIIDPKFFQFDFDGLMAVETAKFSRKFLLTEPVASRIDKSTIAPSLELVPEDASDEVWLDWVKTKSLFQPNYHHLGTCAMLPKDLGGVIDNDFRVYGIDNVRVVDLSVVPFQVAGHSTSLIYAIAEWASQKILD